MSGKKIKNVVFDLGNTLVFFDHNYFFSGIAAFEKRFSTKAFKDFIVENELMDLLAAGAISPKKFYNELKKEFKLTVGYEEFVKIYREIFWSNKPMEKFLDKIVKSKKYGVFLFSNTDNLHIPYLFSVYPHLKLIKKKVISYRVGFIKPHKEIYKHLIEKYGIDPSESFFIDDMQANVETGKKFGFITHHYTDHSVMEKEFKSLK